MRLQGELYQILDYKDGEGKKGKWMKQSFVVKTFDQFPKMIALTCWGELVELVQSLKIYDRIEFDLEVSSREYNDRWYTDLTAHNIEILERHNGEPPLAAQAKKNAVQPDPRVQSDALDSEELDDLPF